MLTTVNGLAFEPDGQTVYVNRWVDERDARGRRRSRLFRHRFSNGYWSPAEPLPFSDEFTDYQPVLSPDGSRLYFTSTRPEPGTHTEARQNIWYAHRSGSGRWGQPRMVAELATPGWDGHAVQTRSGRLYFASDRPGGRGAVDIWMSDMLADSSFGPPVNVSRLNSEHTDNDLYVDPDERFVIFGRSVDSSRVIDLWIAFCDGSGWLAPRPLNAVNIDDKWELSPTVAPGGQFFYFSRDAAIQRVEFCALVRPDERRFLDRTGSPPSCPASARARQK